MELWKAMPVATMLKFSDVQFTYTYSFNDFDCCGITKHELLF